MTDLTLRPCPCGCARLTVEQLGEGEEYLCVVGCFARGCTRIPGVGRGNTPARALSRAAADWNREGPPRGGAGLRGGADDQSP